MRVRLQVSLLSLLLATTFATGIIWKNFDSAREGNGGAVVLVLSLAPVAFLGFLLLSRIVVKVAPPGRGRGG